MRDKDWDEEEYYYYDFDFSDSMWGENIKCLACGSYFPAEEIIIEDIGYGVTEFWGSISNDTRVVGLCPFCNSSRLEF